jgi:hypothetical protein
MEIKLLGQIRGPGFYFPPRNRFRFLKYNTNAIVATPNPTADASAQASRDST